jgi:putative salt-induced outer membrane protein YdiY
VPTTLCAVALLGSILVVQGQAPAAPPHATPAAPAPAKPVKVWNGSLSAGLSITSGNRNTSNFNVAFDLVHDPKKTNVFKADGLYLRGKSEANLTGDQLRVNLRDEVTFNGRGFLFGQARYLRDRFKEIDYLVAPSAGVGYKLFQDNGSSLGVSGGIGGVWEKDRQKGLNRSGSITLDEKLTYKMSPNATVTQSLAALWKTDDLTDALYTFSAGVAAGISARAQLKVELLSTYKNRPTGAALRKNDAALLMGVVYKI